MMSDYGRTQELVTAANTSAGASNDQFGKTLDSLESKVAKLKNAWHEFTMGILDSDLVKFGVDLLTKFLEVINKATGAFDGLGGSLTKIAGTLVVFKMGQKIFEKLKAPLASFFAEIVAEARETGEKAGDAAVQGIKKSKQKTASTSDKPSKEPKTLGGVIKEKSGWSDFQEGRKALKGGTQQAQKVYLDKKKAALEAQKKADRQAEFKAAQEDWDKKKYRKNEDSEKIKAKERMVKAQEELNKEIELTAEELALTKEEQKKIAIQSKDDAWKQLGSGLTQMGQAALGAGTAISMLGGVLSSLGLEEAGEAVSWLGNVIMMLGTAMMAIPPIISAINAILAVPPLGIIMVILAAVLAAIIAIVTVINNNSPEKKLEKAQEAADAAAEAASNAAEAYDKLAESLDNLGDKYDALEELTRGTKEWNEAVQGINNSVLDLIAEYPELASFVENEAGVLTIDIDSDEVQRVLQDAETSKVLTQNASNMADVAVAQANNDVRFSQLEGVEKVANRRAFFWGIDEISETKTDEALQSAIDSLAESVASGDVEANYADMRDHLKEEGVDPAEAEILAEQFAKNLGSLTSYGEAVAAAEAQQKAAYDAIATSAQSLANTLSMTDEEIKQSSVLVDGETSEAFYEEEKKKLEEEIKSGKHLGMFGERDKWKDWQKDPDVLEALNKHYGREVTVDNAGRVTDNTGTQLDKLSRDDLISIMANQYATEQSTKAIEYSDEAIDAVGAVLGSEAIDALYSANEGGALTQTDVTALKKSLGVDFVDKLDEWSELTDEDKKALIEGNKDLYAAWEGDEKLRLAYGNDITKLADDLANGINIADEAFEDAADSVRDFMKANAAQTFQNKLDEVAEKANGEQNSALIEEITDKLLGARLDADGSVIYEDGMPVYIPEEEGGMSADKRAAIQDRINATDWSNWEELLALQIDLEQQFGYTKDEAEAYINSLGDAAYATSGWNTQIKVYGELWKATERVNQSLKRMAHLQWEYDRILSGSSEGSLSGTISNMIVEFSNQATGYSDMYRANLDNLATIYAQGGTNYGVDLREAVTLGDYGINVDESRIQEWIQGGQITQDEVDAWLGDINTYYDASEGNLESLKSTLENIEELEKQGEEAYYELRDMVKDALTSQLQEQIDLQQETLDASKDANDRLIGKIQEQIDADRQERQNEEARENIADLQTQAAYLGMDTSGANGLEILQLEEQIAQAEQDYQDSLIDQSIQSLQDANEKAYEQRERQISIAQAQLDNYVTTEEFQNQVDSALKTLLDSGSEWASTPIGQAMAAIETAGMSDKEKENWKNGISSQITLASAWNAEAWKETKVELASTIKSISDSIDTLSETITSDASGKANVDNYNRLSGSEFNLGALGLKTKKGEDGKTRVTGSGDQGAVTEEQEEKMRRLSSFEENNDDAAASDAWDKIDANRTLAEKTNLDDPYGKILTEKEFYKNYTTDIANSDSGKITLTDELGDYEVSSYSDYITRVSNRPITGLNDLSAMEAYGGSAIPGSSWKGAEWAPLPMVWETSNPFNAKVNGTKDTGVHLGTLVDDSEKSKKLSIIWNATKTSDNDPYVYLANGELYIRQGAGMWWDVRSDFDTGFPSILTNAAKTYTDNDTRKYTKYAYKTGGLADFTGPAWLDGTPSKPEYILNSAQTERFFSLVDVLEGFDDKKSPTNNNNEISVDVDITVENIANDYDVEQLANKIRSMLRDDAMYRNVNNINQVR